MSKVYEIAEFSRHAASESIAVESEIFEVCEFPEFCGYAAREVVAIKKQGG